MSIKSQIVDAFRALIVAELPAAVVYGKLLDAEVSTFFVVAPEIQGDEMEEPDGSSNGAFRVLVDISAYTNFHEDRDRSEVKALQAVIESIIFDPDFIKNANLASATLSFYGTETGTSEQSVSGAHNKENQEITIRIGAKDAL